jgi:hypothetical protein
MRDLAISLSGPSILEQDGPAAMRIRWRTSATYTKAVDARPGQVLSRLLSKP